MDANALLQILNATGVGSLPSSVQSAFTGKICFNTGLLKLSYSMLTIKASIALPINSENSFVRTTIGLLILALILLIIGVIFGLLTAYCASLSSRHKSTARTLNGVGTVILFLGAIFVLGGALAY
uniref:Uncharacterized protein n=1 Tax=Ciona savignyi TaxID=51511 RepID=H2YGT7_CIOSA